MPKKFRPAHERRRRTRAIFKIARATFEGWLSKKLGELNIDDEVFSLYIIGLLDIDDPEDEVKEGLTAF